MKLLIANRGEIALRIQKTARRMSIPVVAVYSHHDRDAQHVLQAGEAVLLPGENLSETYLNIEAVIAAAKKTGANAIHPGYGFLSENPLFSEACEREGITFVGPSAASVRAMGNKIAAREAAVKLGVPVTTGVTGDPDYLLANYDKVGFPMLIKAAAGGGGKGMRIVRTPGELGQALENTSREALNYFGDGTVYIEQFIEGPRHIEFQVLGDKHGNMVHLFERECSAQRRHQKIIEEAPSPALTPGVRKKMGESAVLLASSIGYYSAGTIEFLVDKDLNYYFLEMNTRIQVEHPVTELTTGVDLVEEQIRIANGEKLRFKQSGLVQKGHAIECRIYAEDPFNNFMPSPGKIHLYREPAGQHIRVDSMEIKGKGVIHSAFDPMIGKLITRGETREDARDLMIHALSQFVVQGIQTNIPFLSGLVQHDSFIRNAITTRYIDDELDHLIAHVKTLKASVDPRIPLLAGLLESLKIKDEKKDSVWQTIGYWRNLPEPKLRLDRQEHQLNFISITPGKIKIRENNALTEALLREDDSASYLILDGLSYSFHACADEMGVITVNICGFQFQFERADMARPEHVDVFNAGELKTDLSKIVSPMPGKVMKVNVSEGEKVQKGQVLVVVEAMKMENNVLSPADGLIKRLYVKEGDTVDGSALLVNLDTTS